MLDPIDCADAVQFAKLVKFIVGYCTEGKDQQVRVKPAKGVPTLTTGRAVRAFGE
ncbi:Uncharacterised protein [Burkholderia pseudomallei]|nr:Uncharacterised protein [Burkholderia pseudomallei]